ncbi:MAG: efflux transporter outer membrane subunit [Cyclobacteriaceae bacterium]|nr:efflux transporter outer membrane subunit [Cyclobacteriaceae bacterium]
MNKIILFATLLILASGCLVGPKYSRPETKSPVEYIQTAAHTDSITNLKWWEVYQDTVLQSLIKQALNENLDLMAAVSRVEEAQAALGYNKANLGPSIGYQAGARATDTREISSEAGVTFPGNSYNVMGNVSWEIDIWGKLRHANRAAYAELMAADEDRQSVYISLVAQVAELYFQLRGLDDRISITRRTYESRKEFHHIILLRFEKGEVAELDALQAEQIMAGSESELYRLERQIIIIENALNVLLAQPYTPIARGQANSQQLLPVEIPSGLPSELLERRPDIRFAEQQLIAQTERIGVAVAMRFPSLSLTGFLGVASPDISSLFDPGAFAGSITGQLAGPLFEWGKNKRRVEVERARAQQAGFLYEKTVLLSFAEVENSLAEIRTYRNEHNARNMQVNANTKALMLSKALYDNGYTSFLQVLDAERELFDSQLQESLALENELRSVVRLYKALGGGWEVH